MNATASSASTASVIGRLLAGYCLDQPKSLKEIQKAIAKFKKWAGVESMKKMFAEGLKPLQAFIYMNIEFTILGKVLPETTDLLKSADPAHRIAVELLHFKATGRDPLKKEEQGEGHWAQPLWDLKVAVGRYAEMSPTGVTAEEIANTLKEVLWTTLSDLRQHIEKLIS